MSRGRDPMLSDMPSSSDYEDHHNFNDAPPVVGSMQEPKFDLSLWLRKKYGLPRLSDLPPANEIGKILINEVKLNWKSGLTVALVNVPLSISLAVASDADPVMGIVTAVWSVFFGAPLAGSNYNIVGPTGALSGLLSMYSIRYGEAILPLLAIVCGLLSLIVFFLRLDRFFSLIPNAVAHGFTVGVAFIIALNQLPYALGILGLKRHEEFYMNMAEVFSHLNRTDVASLLTFIIFLASLLILFKKYPRIPWVIVICVLGIIIGAMMSNGAFFYKTPTLHDKYPDLELDIVKIPQFESSYFTMDTLFAASSVCLIAVLETLISAKIADRMTDTKYDKPREVLGVALANIGSGMFGGLPSTAALARTALNVKSGATSRMSTIINAFCVLIIAVGLLPLFRYLMLPVIAAVLVVVAVRMVDMNELGHLWHRDKAMSGVAILTAIVAVMIDPTSAIIVGALIALLLFALQSGSGYGDVSVQRGQEILYSKSIFEIDSLHNKLDINQSAVPPASEFDVTGPVLVYRVTGSIVYLNAEAHCDRVLKVLQDYQTLVISLDSLYFLDVDGMEFLGDVAAKCVKLQKRLVVAGVSNVVLEDLAHLDWFVERQQAGLVFASTGEALDFLEHADQEVGSYGTAGDQSNNMQYFETEDGSMHNQTVDDDSAFP